MKKLLLSIFTASTVSLLAQPTIQLVSTAGRSAYMTTLNGKLYLQGFQSGAGKELFISDGTTAGTTLLKDIIPGSTSSEPRFFTTAINKVFFRAGNILNDSLYVTDGMASGTKSLCKLNTYTIMKEGTEVNGKFYFINGATGTGDELWVTDGTVAGTQMVKDINSGSASSNIAYLTPYNGKMYFKAEDGINGSELWETDGTQAGTILIKDIYPGTSGSQITGFGIFNNKLFFGARDNNANGTELWTSDGTAANTIMLKDISAGLSSSPSNFIVFNNKLYFSATGLGIDVELFQTDGTAIGTVLTSDILTGIPGSVPYGFFQAGNNLFFAAKTCNTCASALHSFSSITNSVTSLGTAFISVAKETYSKIGNLAVISGLTLSDGTLAGTSVVANYNGETPVTAPIYLTELNNEVYFYAAYSNTFGLFKLSGIPASISEKSTEKLVFSIYPNPAKERINIELKMTNNETSDIKITNILGEIVFKDLLSNQNFSFDTFNFKSGVYFVTVENKESKGIQKLIIE